MFLIVCKISVIMKGNLIIEYAIDLPLELWGSTSRINLTRNLLSVTLKHL